MLLTILNRILIWLGLRTDANATATPHYTQTAHQPNTARHRWWSPAGTELYVIPQRRYDTPLRRWSMYGIELYVIPQRRYAAPLGRWSAPSETACQVSRRFSTDGTELYVVPQHR